MNCCQKETQTRRRVAFSCCIGHRSLSGLHCSCYFVLQARSYQLIITSHGNGTKRVGASLILGAFTVPATAPYLHLSSSFTTSSLRYVYSTNKFRPCLTTAPGTVTRCNIEVITLPSIPVLSRHCSCSRSCGTPDERM